MIFKWTLKSSTFLHVLWSTQNKAPYIALTSTDSHWYSFCTALKNFPSFSSLLPVYPLLPRDLCAVWCGLRVHASQVCSGGRPAAHHRLPQLDTDSSAEQHGERPHHQGARAGATLHQGVPQVMVAQWSSSIPLLCWPKTCSCFH